MEWPLLATLSDEERREVLAIAHRRRFRRNEVVFHEGDLGNALHLVVRGRFAVRTTTFMGDIATLEVVGMGDFFGELALLGADPGRRTATVNAFDSAETMAIDRDSFGRLRRDYPGVDRLLVEVLATRVRRLSDQLAEALYSPVEARVARRLLHAAERWGGAQNGTIVPVTQEDLAGMAGTTRPTVNKVIGQFVEMGLVSVARGRLVLVDSTGLTKRGGLHRT
jgi:CRP-like cAMP-binding protein